ARDFGLARGDRGLAIGDHLPDVLVRVDPGPGLVDVGNPDRLADDDRAVVGLILAHDHLEQGRLADAVRAADADNAVRRDGEADVLDQHPVAVSLREILYLNDQRPETRTGRDLDLLEVELAVLLGFGGHLFVTLEPGPALGLPCPRARPHPFKLVL